MNTRKLVVAALAVTGALAAGASQARDHVQWSVNIGLPVVTLPAPPMVVVSQPVVEYGYPAQYEYPAVRYPVAAPRYVTPRPVRWDSDGDGIPNRYDRVYNPRWDRDGDGIPNRYDRHDGRRHDRDGDGIPNWRDNHNGRNGYGR